MHKVQKPERYREASFLADLQSQVSLATRIDTKTSEGNICQLHVSLIQLKDPTRLCGTTLRAKTCGVSSKLLFGGKGELSSLR